MIHIVLTLVFSSLISFFSYRLKFLTKNGTAAVFALALLIYGLGELKWTVPILTFFILSSALSKLRRKRNSLVDEAFEKNSRRDALQVIANGGFGGLIIIVNHFIPSELLYFVFVSSVATVCADTWSTETGTMFKAKTISVINFKVVKQGTSGGISVIGTAGGIAGSIVIAAASLPWMHADHNAFILAVILSALFGNLMDSVFGALFQAQFKCSQCGIITERKNHCSKDTMLIQGHLWINNDFVNFTTSILGGLFSIIFLL